MTRSVVLSVLLFIFFGLDKLISYNEFSAKNCGCILTFVITVAMTEINVSLGQYRLYEGFLTQISLSYVLSV